MREIAWKAQTRLCQRYRHMMAKGKLKQVVVTAIARELAGFVWSIACITSDPREDLGCMPETVVSSSVTGRSRPRRARIEPVAADCRPVADGQRRARDATRANQGHQPTRADR